MEFLTEIWGSRDHIGPLEVMERGTVMFVVMMVLLRITGMRSFSKGSVFDNLMIILLGAILGRGVVGGTPFFSALFGGVWLVLIHKFISQLTFFSRDAGRYIKGEPVLLFKEGTYFRDQMRRCDMTENDIYEELRVNLHLNSMDSVTEVYMERSGKISFVLKEDSARL